MYEVRLQSGRGGVELIRRVEEQHIRLLDLGTLADRIATLMLEDQRGARDAGEDRFGMRLADLAEATLRDRRRAGGPPLAPTGTPPKYGLGLTRDFAVRVSQVGPHTWEVVGSFPTAPFLRYHRAGPEHPHRLPVRDIVGIRPVGHELILRAAHEHVDLSLRV